MDASGSAYITGGSSESWGSPLHSQSGDYDVFVLKLNENSGDVNRPPVLNPIGSKSVAEGKTLSFTVTATDPDGDALAYSANNLPAGANFDPATRTFTWTPDYGQTGDFPDVMFTVTDDGVPSQSASEAITITVGNPCEGDFDGDGDVDGSDFAVFTGDFGRANCDIGDPCEGDFDGNNEVDGLDLADFAADFVRTDCPNN
jgi:hypothetical protein